MKSHAPKSAEREEFEADIAADGYLLDVLLDWDDKNERYGSSRTNPMFNGWLLARRRAAMQAAEPVLSCWSCKKPYAASQRLDADGQCPHCDVEIELDDEDAAPDRAPSTGEHCAVTMIKAVSAYQTGMRQQRQQREQQERNAAQSIDSAPPAPDQQATLHPGRPTNLEDAIERASTEMHDFDSNEKGTQDGKYE
jgi:hypothetical protein